MGSEATITKVTFIADGGTVVLTGAIAKQANDWVDARPPAKQGDAIRQIVAKALGADTVTP